MYYETFREFHKLLGNLDSWLGKAADYAKTKAFDPNVLVTARLAPDQLPFSFQIQSACDTAKLGASRLTGKEAPSNRDTEATIDELRARVQGTRAYVEAFTAADFAEAATRTISNPRWEGKTMTGANYFMEHVMPNFFFHLTHTYAILRHNGVPVGKRDYLGELTKT